MSDPSDADRLDADLTLLVDGQLEPERAAQLEVRADLAPRIERVRAGRDRMRVAAASVEAPFELRRRLEALPAHPQRRPRWRPLAALAGVGAAAAVALVLVTAGGAPTVGDVLDSTGRSPAAAVAPYGGPLLPVAVEGVRFPNYREKFGWRALGRRDDEIDGRDVTTVVYAHGGERVRYSIVAGDALDEPDGEDIEAEGTRLRRADAGNAVTWRRLDHTCVMDGSAGVSLRTVAELAAWKAKGEVAF